MTNILSVEKTIAQIFKKFCDWKESSNLLLPEKYESQIYGKPPEVGLVFHVLVRGNNYGYEKDGNTRHPEWEKSFYQYLTVIILRTRKVFVAVSDCSKWNEVPVDAFENITNHDSCWESSGFGVSDLFYKAYHTCYPESIPKEHRPSPAQANISAEMSGMFQSWQLFDYAMVSHAPVEASNTYFRRITSIKKMDFTITLVEAD